MTWIPVFLAVGVFVLALVSIRLIARYLGVR
jgi:hypothetical protein